MYRAVGENSWRDGVFSHAAPAQSYQGSTRQFADGALGATARLVQNGAFRDGALGRRPLLPSLKGALGSVFRDGSLGRGVFRDGSLGDSGTVTLPNGNVVTVGPAAQAVPFYKQPAAILAGGIVIGAVGYYLWKKK